VAGASQLDYEQRVNRVIDHVRTHLAEELSLATLARVAAFSPFHFHRVFRAVTGETLFGFIQRQRLEKAAGALHQHPGLTGLAIALDHGLHRWRLADPELSERHLDHYRIGFDPFDVPRDQFLVGGRAWQRCRGGDADPETFGLAPELAQPRGLSFVRGHVVQDLAALNKMELLLWDVWGLMEADVGAELALLDEVAEHTQAADGFADARRLYASPASRCPGVSGVSARRPAPTRSRSISTPPPLTDNGPGRWRTVRPSCSTTSPGSSPSSAPGSESSRRPAAYSTFAAGRSCTSTGCRTGGGGPT
jgi:AraC-like DNA-binding protein